LGGCFLSAPSETDSADATGLMDRDLCGIVFRVRCEGESQVIEPPRQRGAGAKRMFVRKTTVTENRKKQVYLEIFRDETSHRRQAKPLARLGPVNLVGGEVDQLVKGLREFCQDTFVSAGEISVETVRSWGPVLIARHLWDETGLGRMISAACGADVAEAVFALTANRLVDPNYEYGMDEWLMKSFVAPLRGDADGLDADRPAKRGIGTSSATATNLWDATLHKLAARRRAIERRFLEAVRPFCGDTSEVFFYEVGGCFIEGASSRRRPAGWPGQSRQRNIRLFLGVITGGDWPLNLRFFGGSEPGAAQIKRFVQESQRRIGFRKLIVVLPSGTDDEKLHELCLLGLHYLVGVRRRRDPRAVEAVQEAGRRWERINSNTKVQEVLLPVETDSSVLYGETEDLPTAPTARYFLVHGAEEEKQERAIRMAVVRRALRALEQLNRAVRGGRLKKPATIMARAERILAERKAYRYISWRITPEGRFLYWEDKAKSAVRRNYEGISLLKTSDPDISPSSAVLAYDGLRRLQNAYGRIYDTVPFRSPLLPLPPLEADPHHASGVGELFTGHLLITWLAFLLRCRLEKSLLEKKISLSLEEAVEALRTVSLAELRMGEQKRPVVSPGSRMAKRIFRALGIEDLLPNTPSAPP